MDETQSGFDTPDNCRRQEGCTPGYGLVESGCGLLGNPLSSYVEVWGDGTSDVYPNWTDCSNVNRVLYREGCGLAQQPITDWVTLYENGEKDVKTNDRRCSNLSCATRTLYTEWDGRELIAVKGDLKREVIATRQFAELAPTVIMSGTTRSGRQVNLYSNGTIKTEVKNRNSRTISLITRQEVTAETLGTTLILSGSTEIKTSGCGLAGFSDKDFVVEYWKDRVDVYPLAVNCKAVSLVKKGCNTATGSFVKVWSDGTRDSFPDGQCLSPQYPSSVNDPDNTQ